MNLFFKIFLWFLAAIALMVGVVVFLNWTVQPEPAGSRWQNSVRNQMNIFADTAAQIEDNEGDDALKKFIDRIATADTVADVDVVTADGRSTLSDRSSTGYIGLISQTRESGLPEIELGESNSAFAARGFLLKDGRWLALIVRWERPRSSVPFFGESWLRIARMIGLLATAIILCYALAKYISSPIDKIRLAAQRLAAGDLRTRVADEFGTRHDEIGTLAADFDLMAERIESLLVSQKQLSRDISHELRSPLARLNVALELAKQKARGEASPLLDRIETESNRLNEMIGRILMLSKLESGSSEIEKVPIDLTALVREVVADADFEAAARHKSVQLAAEPCVVTGSEVLLRSAIENVLRNAVRYTAESTAVRVSLENRNGNVVVGIRDAGGGVPEEELPKLFRPFYRIGEARERKTGGIGLGLAIADRAVRAHQGKITAKNSDGGLLIEITLKRRPD